MTESGSEEPPPEKEARDAEIEKARGRTRPGPFETAPGREQPSPDGKNEDGKRRDESGHENTSTLCAGRLESGDSGAPARRKECGRRPPISRSPAGKQAVRRTPSGQADVELRLEVRRRGTSCGVGERGSGWTRRGELDTPPLGRNEYGGALRGAGAVSGGVLDPVARTAAVVVDQLVLSVGVVDSDAGGKKKVGRKDRRRQTEVSGFMAFMGRRGYFGRPGLSIKTGMEVLRDLADHFDLHGGVGGKPLVTPLFSD